MAEWYTKIAEQVVGPLSAEQLKALADEGRLAPGDPVAKSTEGPWVAASRVKGLFEVAAIDDEPEEETTPPEPVTGQAPPTITSTEQNPLERPLEEPPIPQPPVVMPAATKSETPLSQSSSGPPADAAPPAVESAPVGGFAIQTEEVTAAERFQKKKRVKKPREPLTKKQKNARLVKWLAIAIVSGGVVLFSIPFLRNLFRSEPEAVATSNPIAGDVDLAAASKGLEDAFGASSRAGGPRPKPTVSQRTSESASTTRSEPMEEDVAAPASANAVEVKPVRVVLDRPRLTGADGRAGRPANRFLLIELELKAKDPDGSTRFRGWSSYAKEISLTDEHNVQYDVRTPQNFDGMFVDGQCQEMVFLSADKPTTDVVVFAWPEDMAPGLPSASEELLKLRLPKSAYGEQGELRISIPLSEIDVTEAAMEKPRGGPPAAMPGTSDNVEDDDGGPIRIPGLTD